MSVGGSRDKIGRAGFIDKDFLITHEPDVILGCRFGNVKELTNGFPKFFHTIGSPFFIKFHYQRLEFYLLPILLGFRASYSEADMHRFLFIPSELEQRHIQRTAISYF